MIPTLYDKTGTIKIGDLIDCIECLVEEERNGIFELTLVYPSTSEFLDSIVYENIIICDANDHLKSQKFRIYNTRRLMSNRVEVCARHISFDLAHDWIDKIEFENQSCEYALNQIFRNSQFCQHFRGHSDIINAQNFKIEAVTCLSAIGGTKGSVLDTYGNGAEVLRDNLDIHVLNRRGHDNDVSIEYRKNLTGFELEEDTTDLVTRILPYAKYYDRNNKNEEVIVKGNFIDSPNIDNYAHPYVKYIDYSDKFDGDDSPTVEQLEELATKEYTVNKVDIPKQNFKIEFVPLSKCAGYEGLEDRINLCDVVTIRDTRYGIDTQSKVIKVTYNALRDRYESMELGEPKTTLGDIVGGGSVNGPTQGEQGPPGANGDLSDFPNELPHVPVISAIVYGFANVEISWTFENKIYYTYELYASKTKGFTPNVFDLVFSGQASTFLHQLQPNETWYYRVCAINTHGSRTEFSEEIQVNTVKIEDLSNYVAEMAISDALIGELNLGRGWFGQLKGNYIDAKQLSVTDGNGKRTLDIDSFGNVNLDVTTLKIKNNDVATSSQLQQTTSSITATVESNYTDLDGKIKNANSQIQQNAANIQSKVDVNGVKSVIQQNPDSVKIGFNGISDVIDIASNGITVTHNKGQTKMTDKGFEYIVNGNASKYRCMSYYGEFYYSFNSYLKSFTINVPDEFKGRSYDVMVNINSIETTPASITGFGVYWSNKTNDNFVIEIKQNNTTNTNATGVVSYLILS